MNPATILIMAGGTGGHVFPALAVARELRARNQQVIWLGTRHGLESKLVPGEGFPMELVRVAGLRRKGLVSWLLAPWKLMLALADALQVLRRIRPRVVLGMGGFASGPGGLAAWLTRRPLVIHEQNAVAGLTNRLLAYLARDVLEAFPGSFSPSRRARSVGNPVRRDILELDAPDRRLQGRAGALRVLVLGGSQGALALNRIVPAAVALLPPSDRPEVLHQAGSSTLDEARANYAECGVNARVLAFLDDMAGAYGWADLVVCRAGALTVSELAAAGLGAIMVPYPSAVDDHQTRNGEYLVAAGAGQIIQQSDLTPSALADAIAIYLGDRSQVLQRAERARSLARPGATRDLADACLAAGEIE